MLTLLFGEIHSLEILTLFLPLSPTKFVFFMKRKEFYHSNLPFLKENSFYSSHISVLELDICRLKGPDILSGFSQNGLLP